MKLLDKYLLKHRMYDALGYWPDLKHPRTFNEKMGWRILNDRNPLFPKTIDKLLARGFVSIRIGQDILLPLLGVWNDAYIPWNELPNRFALKASHGWNMNLFIEDKKKADRYEIITTTSKWLKHSHYRETGEWGYKDIEPRLFAEELLSEFIELKFHVFNGKARILRVHENRFTDHRVTFFDDTLTSLPVAQGIPRNPEWMLPGNIDQFFEVAERLGEGFDYVRVDLYAVKEQMYFSELTHYESSACRPFEPVSFDRTLGDMWRLPT